jgi:cytochrome c-type biogenesis protein CcmH/NrfG
MSPLGKRIVVFFMLWVFLVMILIQVYDNVTGKGMPVKVAPTAVAAGVETPDPDVAKLAELQSCLASNPNDLSCTMQLGQLYYAAQQWPQAQVNYERAVKLDPTSVEALVKLSGTYIYQLDFEQAANTLTQARALQPDSPEINLLLGLAFSRLEPPKKTEALAAWRKVIEVAPGSTWAEQADAFIKDSGP